MRGRKLLKLRGKMPRANALRKCFREKKLLKMPRANALRKCFRVNLWCSLAPRPSRQIFAAPCVYAPLCRFFCVGAAILVRGLRGLKHFRVIGYSVWRLVEKPIARQGFLKGA